MCHQPRSTLAPLTRTRTPLFPIVGLATSAIRRTSSGASPYFSWTISFIVSAPAEAGVCSVGPSRVAVVIAWRAGVIGLHQIKPTWDPGSLNVMRRPRVTSQIGSKSAAPAVVLALRTDRFVPAKVPAGAGSVTRSQTTVFIGSAPVMPGAGLVGWLDFAVTVSRVLMA